MEVLYWLCVFLHFPFNARSSNFEIPGMLFPRDSESREVKDLSGFWNFRADMSANRNAGFEGKWFSKPLWQTGDVIAMPVPSSYNDITQDKALRDFIGWVWYDREVYVPKAWNSEDVRVNLRFESAHYNTIVWLNGEEVMKHSGGHLPFEADVTSKLSYDKTNRITAAVNNTLTPSTLPPGAVRYLEGDMYPPGYFVMDTTFDFFNYAGIHRPVKLYTTPAVFLSDITVTTNHTDQVGVVNFSVGITSYVGDTNVSMKYELVDKAGNVVSSTGGPSLFVGKLSVTKPMLWWPIGMSDEPAYLYTLKVTTQSTSPALQDIYRLPVGIRSVEVKGTQFLINNKPFYFKGFGKHEDADIRGKGMDYAIIAKDFNMIKWLGANCFRTSHYPYADEIMDMADMEGIVVIDESPGVGIKKENFINATLNHHHEVMAELVRRDKNRPSVVMWSVANEPASSKPGAEAYFKSVIGFTRTLDPTRPVTFVTAASAKTDRAVQFVDVILCNRYYAWYQDCGQTQLISRQLEIELRNWFDTFHKPVVQSEYGADTVAGLHMDPPYVFTEDYQVETIQQYFPVFDKLRKDFFVGELIWNFADFMTKQQITRVVGNKKGILTRQRQPKAAAHVLRMRYLNISIRSWPGEDGRNVNVERVHGKL
ncbi:beta-glucuronidase-like [Acropora palmata]|uniref:beta-glucuronidase-like n=1 Tax=Acropora palmata TaxID=6131 RepID=UPI003DA04ADD